MFEALQQPPVSAETIADLRAQDVLYYRHVLQELIEIGANVARMVGQEAQSQTQAQAEYSQRANKSAEPSRQP
jgi:hypothetical protein